MEGMLCKPLSSSTSSLTAAHSILVYLSFQTTAWLLSEPSHTFSHDKYSHPWQRHLFLSVPSDATPRVYINQKIWDSHKGSAQWGRQGLALSVEKGEMQSALQELQTCGCREQHWTQALGFTSSAGRALLSRGNSAPCEKSHYSHLGLFLPRKFHGFWQINSTAHSCCLLSVFLSVETSVFC